MRSTIASKSIAVALGAALTIGGALASSGASAQEARNYVLTTASTGGTYYPVGVALATLTKVKLQPKFKMGMSAINSAGSGENVRLLRENEAQFAILQGLFGHYAKTGTGPVKADGPQKDLRSVTMLWPNVEQYLLHSDMVKSGNMDDMIAAKGKGMAMGKKNSGTLGSNFALLGNLGVDIDTDYELFYAGYGPSADAVQDGKVVGGGFTGGPPTGAVTKMFAAMGDKISFLEFTPEQAKMADGGMELWTPYVIAADTYPGQSNPVNTIAQPNFLAVRSDVPDEDVYMLTKTIYENLGFLQAIHAATKSMALESAIAGLPLPLHPGAARYYKEVGIDIPDRLMAK